MRNRRAPSCRCEQVQCVRYLSAGGRPCVVRRKRGYLSRMVERFERFSAREIAAHAVDAIRRATEDVLDGRYEDALNHRHEAAMWSQLLVAVASLAPESPQWDEQLWLPTSPPLRPSGDERP